MENRQGEMSRVGGCLLNWPTGLALKAGRGLRYPGSGASCWTDLAGFFAKTHAHMSDQTSTHTCTHRHRHTRLICTHPRTHSAYTHAHTRIHVCAHTQCIHRHPSMHICVHAHAHTCASDTLTLTPSSCLGKDGTDPLVRGVDAGSERMSLLILCCHLVATSQMAARRRLGSPSFRPLAPPGPTHRAPGTLLAALESCPPWSGVVVLPSAVVMSGAWNRVMAQLSPLSQCCFLCLGHSRLPAPPLLCGHPREETSLCSAQ